MPETRDSRINAIAFYLPQFHRIPENDEWWEPGFTEWTNVRRAKALYRNHVQPRVPTDLGHYDLTHPNTRVAQAQLAASVGIEAFCYWHYWFGNGRRILERPFTEVLSTGSPDFPFCLCWANQSWTGIWHGAPKRMLMEQTYPGEEDNKAHFDLVREAFEDPRYLRIDGKPVFVVYAPAALPSSDEFVKSWRRWASESGLPGLHLIGMGADPNHPSLLPFDAVVLNEPGEFLDRHPLSAPQKILRRVAASSFGRLLPNGVRTHLGAPRVFEYRDMVEEAFTHVPRGDRFVPCVIPGWDNTPRSGRRGVVIRGADEALFERYLGKAVERVASNSPRHRLVFIKAWNEWAEGNYLEPDLLSGADFLEAVRRVTSTAPSDSSEDQKEPMW